MPHYEVVFYDGEGQMPAYYLIDGVEGETPEQALALNLDRLIGEVQKKFGFDEAARRHVRESLYLVRAGGLLSARES